ncbi:hypothetical protein [Neobacillus cucumis]|uniref:hypothetical protein n=1 Tax=Neobacillus cucumis TaxID=1740721 RepID=UPI0019625E60|nr:hypothetical protein [Neobacillus cucumis]MBM7651970.1 hypothetical protein [Neobacillus cucumis]
MKLYKVVGTSFIAISLLGLFGCENNSSSSQTQHNNSTVENHTDQSQQDKTRQASGKSTNGVQSPQNSGSNQSSGNDQTGSTNQKTPPKTKQEALNNIAKQLKTKVPLMMPKNVPVDVGKYLTATTTSQAWHYQIKLYETDIPVNINSQDASKGTLIATVEGTEYKDIASAEKAISGYTQADISQNSVDLGQSIKGTMDGAMGHSYILWNEGSWSINVDSPNDPTYQNEIYPDGLKLAQKIVAYLNDHTLPAPQKNGVITIRNWQQGPETTIEWQYHEMTYQITSPDPIKALEVATH